jgi:hypothetical protein
MRRRVWTSSRSTQGSRSQSASTGQSTRKRSVYSYSVRDSICSTALVHYAYAICANYGSTLGSLTQNEFCLRTDHFLTGDPFTEHQHNQLVAGIFSNCGRDPPEPGVAPWVSANDKPVVQSKPTAGDAVEQRLKSEVMQLPARDRRRLKEVAEVSASAAPEKAMYMAVS